MAVNSIFLFILIIGHGFSYWMLGSEYNTWSSTYKENWAIDYVNWSYRTPYNIPKREFLNYFNDKKWPWYDPFGWSLKGHNP